VTSKLSAAARPQPGRHAVALRATLATLRVGVAALGTLCCPTGRGLCL